MKTKTLLMIGMLVLGSLVAPVVAQGGPEGRPGGPPDDRPGHARDDNRSRGPDNHTHGPDDNRSRGPPAHVMERLESRCEAVENETGRRPAACDRLSEIHDGQHRARRAAHAGLQAVAAWEHLNATLTRLEAHFQEKLAQENLTANQTAAYEAKLERIDAMQERLAQRIDAMQERIAGMQERWEAVREHVAERRAARGPPAEAESPGDAEGSGEDPEAGS